MSILAPTHRTAPANKQDPIKVKNLVSKAIKRLQAEFPKREVAAVVEKPAEARQDSGLATHARRAGSVCQ